MRNSHIEYPELKAIRGTDLAYILTPCAVNVKNGYEKYIDYLASKTSGQVTTKNNEAQRVLREYCYKIYKRNGMAIEQLEGAIKENSAQLVGDMTFAISGQNFELDDNGNLLLRSYGSALDDVNREGGDVLMDDNGKILRNSRGHMFIHSANPFGYYPCDVFVAKSRGMFEPVEIVRIDFNFLTPNGHLVRQQNFERLDSNENSRIEEVVRTFSSDVDGKRFIDSTKTIYPKAYVYNPNPNSSEGPMFFPSATALLIENRSRVAEGESPIVEDETPYIIEHYNRMKQIPLVQRKLSDKSAKGTMGFKTYIEAIENISTEEILNKIFGEMETAQDLEILNGIEYGDITFEA